VTNGNGARFAARPMSSGGTSTETWLGWGRAFPELGLDDCPGLVLVSPHPDDETLGFGATAALLRARGVEVTVVSVSDGGGAYPGLSRLERSWLERDRRAELITATKALGLDDPVCLGLPDGELAAQEDRLTARIVELLAAATPGTWCAATWRGDGHPDHEAVGRAAAAATELVGTTLLEYPVWMWHWAEPDDVDVPWERMCTAPVDRVAQARKRVSVNAFHSQLTPPRSGAEPVVPPWAVQRLLRVGEVAFR
jgi:LmbE family N-acetylglucosaminyl deacetylase